MKEENITIKKCLGCGAILQYVDEEKSGYIPENKYKDSDYCKRCFQLTHYNKRTYIDPNLDNEKIINEINKLDTYVFFLTDFFNISNEVIKIFKSINKNKTLIISKSDLIPKDINKNNIIQKIKNIYEISENIIFISNKDKKYSFIDELLEEFNVDTCHILGFTNAGKSTFINNINKDNTITTSNQPNTTLDFVSINYGKYKVIDTPGFTLNKTFYHIDENNLIKRLNPKYYIKPKVYQSKQEQIFNIEDRLYLNFGNNNTIFYMSNLISIKKIYKASDIKFKEIKIEDNTDVVIPSLGFITIKKECVLCVNETMIELIEIRNSLF